MAATTLARSRTALGAYYRRIAQRKDGSVAVLATARKLACIIYRALHYGQAYVDTGANTYEQAYAARRLKSLEQVARGLGFGLVPIATDAAASPG